MAFVLDASVALAWVMPGEHSEAASRIRALLPAHEAWVPSLWSLEVLNVVALGERQGRFAADGGEEVAQLLREIPVRVDDATFALAWTDTLALSRRHRLTTYDAAYLELAKRRQLSLATLDGALKKAARTEKVKLL